jgi:hypothetical protein
MHVVITIDVDDAKVDLVAGAMHQLRGDVARLGWQLLEVEKRVVPHIVEERRREAEAADAERLQHQRRVDGNVATRQVAASRRPRRRIAAPSPQRDAPVLP